MCFRPAKFPKERQQETLVLLENFVVIMKNLKQYLKFNGVALLCRLAECSITLISLQMKGMHIPDGSEESAFPEPFALTDIPEKMSSLWKEQCEFVYKFLDDKLSGMVKQGSGDCAKWGKELQVSNC